MLEHLKRLSHPVGGDESAWGIAVYCERRETPDGFEWREVVAAQSGLEGVACVDDAARAAVLALRLAHERADVDAERWARRWLGFVLRQQHEDGRVVNFIYDWDGRPNLTGPTSRPGGEWWTARALWALGAGYRHLGCRVYRAAFRAALPERPTGFADIDAVTLLGVAEFLRRERDPRLLRLARDLGDGIAATHDGYLRHEKGREELHLWGYEQMHALMQAADVLGTDDYDQVCRETAYGLLRHLIESGWQASYPSGGGGLYAYSLAPSVRGLAAFYHRTGEELARDLALKAAAWFYGRNSAGRAVYDPATGICWDYVEGTFIKHTAGAESSIEASLAELERARLAAPSTEPCAHPPAPVTHSHAAGPACETLLRANP